MFFSVARHTLTTSAKVEGSAAAAVGKGGDSSDRIRLLSREPAASFWSRPSLVMKRLVSFGAGLGRSVISQVMTLSDPDTSSCAGICVSSTSGRSGLSSLSDRETSDSPSLLCAYTRVEESVGAANGVRDE
jgi:hypothetical protein